MASLTRQRLIAWMVATSGQRFGLGLRLRLGLGLGSELVTVMHGRG